MPYLKITASKSIPADRQHALLKTASKLVAAELGKPEQYVMVSVEAPAPMFFAGSAEPAAFLELRGIGLPTSKTGALSQRLCEMVEAQLGIRMDRVYINFADVAPELWGWNGETF